MTNLLQMNLISFSSLSAQSAVYKIKSMVYEFGFDLDQESFVPKL